MRVIFCPSLYLYYFTNFLPPSRSFFTSTYQIHKLNSVASRVRDERLKDVFCAPITVLTKSLILRQVVFTVPSHNKTPTQEK